MCTGHLISWQSPPPPLCNEKGEICQKFNCQVLNPSHYDCSQFFIVASEKLETIEIQIFFETVHRSEYNTSPTGNEHNSKGSVKKTPGKLSTFFQEKKIKKLINRKFKKYY